MPLNPRISLEQWRSLLAVVDSGGYAQAAAALHKSQSAVTYAVQKMESLLGVKIFEVIGRKAHLTATGEVLYRRAKALLDEAGALESAAGAWRPDGSRNCGWRSRSCSPPGCCSNASVALRWSDRKPHRALRDSAQRHRGIAARAARRFRHRLDRAAPASRAIA